MTTYFTSDTHFGHENLIRFGRRPFKSLKEMDDTLIANWNAVVQENDTVYHLGDFSFRNEIGTDVYRARLKGKIHLIIGNHDTETLKHYADIFASINHILEIKLEGQHIVLCHYPMREWHQAWRASWHLFGHVHGRLDHEPRGYSLDVGVDSHNFCPVSFEEIGVLMDRRENCFVR